MKENTPDAAGTVPAALQFPKPLIRIYFRDGETYFAPLSGLWIGPGTDQPTPFKDIFFEHTETHSLEVETHIYAYRLNPAIYPREEKMFSAFIYDKATIILKKT